MPHLLQTRLKIPPHPKHLVDMTQMQPLSSKSGKCTRSMNRIENLASIQSFLRQLLGDVIDIKFRVFLLQFLQTLLPKLYDGLPCLVRSSPMQDELSTSSQHRTHEYDS